jgi:RNA polymerase sigma factor (sigma-70 family)
LSKPLSLGPERGEGTPEERRIEAVLESYRGYISDIVTRLTPRGMGVDPSEIEQETTVRLWRCLRNERDIRDYRSYVYRIAATAALDAIREIRKRMEEALVVEQMSVMSDHSALPGSRAVSPERALMEKRLVSAIAAAVEELPANRRRAAKLHLQGFTSEEVGALCGWSEAKARNLVYRAMADLRAKLKKAGVEVDE